MLTHPIPFVSIRAKRWKAIARNRAVLFLPHPGEWREEEGRLVIKTLKSKEKEKEFWDCSLLAPGLLKEKVNIKRIKGLPMRKLFIGWCIAVLLLTFPGIAGATSVGTGTLQVTWTAPIERGYFLDYDGSVTFSDFGYTTGLKEIFCVSKQQASKVESDITFYEIDSDLYEYDKFAQAAWIATNWITYVSDNDDIDIAKGEAQKAVWEAMGLWPAINWVGSSGLDFDIYDDSTGRTSADYLNAARHWYYADSASYQDYLTPKPTPEPATMLLFGSGLIGLASLRKKFLK